MTSPTEVRWIASESHRWALFPKRRSRGEGEVEFFHQWPEAFAESFIDRAEDVVGVEMLAIDAAAGADVVAHLFEPGKLVGSEGNSGSALLVQPGCEALTNVFFEWL